MRHFKPFALRSSAALALLGALSFSANAQVTISEDSSDQIRTSTSGDVTVENEATVTVDSSRAGLVLDSDNDITLAGSVEANNVDGATGVELQGGNEGSYTQTGSITVSEDYTLTNTDDDPFTDGPFAEGQGRTGILISGASPFRGNVELAAGSTVQVQGNDSFGVNLANTPMMTAGLTGNLTTSGQIGVVGDRSTGVNIASNVIGNVTNEGSVVVRGTDSQAYVISGDIDGGFASSGTLSASGYRSDQRLNFGGDTGRVSDRGREDLTAEDLRQGGAVLNVSGNISDGIFLNQRFQQAMNDDGSLSVDANGDPIFTSTVIAASNIQQAGSAPAVIIDGNGSPIAIGLVAQITDPTDPDFDSTLQYGFINRGTIAANGVFNDFDATAISLSNVTIDGGISNSGTLEATAFRSPNPSDFTDGNGVARVLILGDQAIADEINNSGIINASVSEDADEVYADRNNIIAPRPLLAIAIDIREGASVTNLVNSGAISSNILLGRDGTTIAIRDASGTVRRLDNTGAITTSARTSDTLGLEETEFNLIAIDFSANTSGVEINQSQNPDIAFAPSIRGDILLGSGDDSIVASAGTILGDVDFGGGADTLSLSGGSVFLGGIQNTDSLDLSVTGESTLALRSSDDIQVSEALIDSTSVFRPLIDGATGEASTLISSGDITFESGAAINPILNSIIGTNTLSYTLASASNLTIGDLASLSAGDSPFLYNTNLSLSDPNTLIVTLDLRDPTASVENGGLGLDAVQAAAFGSVVDGVFQEGAAFQALTATSDLGNAFANITEADEFYAAYNQILPEFSGAAKQFVLANVDGAVGAVGSHLDAARRSPDKPGGAWLQEFFYFADRDLAGLSEQYRGEGFGFSGGIDTALGPFHAVGLSVGFASTEVEDVIGNDEPLNVRTYQGGAYAGFEKNGFNIDVYGGGGISEFEQNRIVSVGDFLGTAEGEWEGLHANAALRAGYEVALSEKFWARPSVSVDYLYLNEYGHTETGTEGVRLRVDGRSSETAAATAMLDFGAKFQGKRTWIRPSLRVGYRNEFISDPLETAFRFQGLSDSDGNLFDSELARLRAFAFPDEGILLGFTVAAGSEYSAIGFDFDSDIRDGFIRHTGRVVIRLLF